MGAALTKDHVFHIGDLVCFNDDAELNKSYQSLRYAQLRVIEVLPNKIIYIVDDPSNEYYEKEWDIMPDHYHFLASFGSKNMDFKHLLKS